MPVRSAVKLRRSFTLSTEAVMYLNRLRRDRKASSLSAVVEGLIEDARSTDKRRAAVDRQFKDYYDSMSDAEQREMNGWAELGTRALASLPD